MAAIRWRHEARVDASPDVVYAWLTDYREDDHSRPAYLRGAGVADGGTASSRRVASRDGDVVAIEDHWGRRTFRARVTLDAATRSTHIVSGFGYDATWRAEADGDGTRLIVEGRIAPRGIGGLLVPLFRKGFLKQMAEDFRGHVADLEDEIARRER